MDPKRIETCMLDGATFRDIVSERRQGVAPSFLRGLLRAAEVPYSLAIDWRNRRYDRGHAAVRGVSVPVISVGNLTLGGTGKTPMVKWLARRLAERGIRVAIVSRGYGARSKEQGARSEENWAAGKGQDRPRDNPGSVLPAPRSPLPALNDEAMELEQALPDVPHVQNPDRVAGAQRAIDQFGCQLVLLDDGFQHRRLARDLDIVLLDALEPFGHEHVFPRGTLREPLAALQRAHVVCLTRATAIATHEREAIRRRVYELAPQAAWCEAAHAPTKLITAAADSRPLSLLSGKRVAAFCGIGNPAGFRHTLASTGAQIVGWREFPDHHAFTTADQKELEKFVARSDAELVVCTHKDLVKLRQNELAGRPLWAVEIEMQFVSGRELIEELVKRVTDGDGRQAPGSAGG
ncbi:MAG TPA: tetraacyldisaccharide 4'-kinase [Lacipirellulaceae bacterium]